MATCAVTLSIPGLRVCGDCQQFYRGKCGLHFPECKDAQSLAEDCPLYQPEGEDPAWMTEE